MNPWGKGETQYSCFQGKVVVADLGFLQNVTAGMLSVPTAVPRNMTWVYFIKKQIRVRKYLTPCHRFPVETETILRGPKSGYHSTKG